MGWKRGRASVLAYQTGGASSSGLPADPHQRWRSMFIEDLHDAVITDGPWHTADNYPGAINSIDLIEIQV